MARSPIVTNIGLEHTEILGKTRAAIAREKVGILKPGAALVTTLDADDEAGRRAQARADELGSRVKRTAASTPRPRSNKSTSRSPPPSSASFAARA